MRYRRLGRTGLNVSVLSLGTGGPNRLGQSRYVSRSHINRLIGLALDLGINLFDTSAAYEHSETRLGAALRGVPRERYFLAGKIFPWHHGKLLSAAEIRRIVDRSLKRLGVRELDILQLHRVRPDTYQVTRDHMLPELEKLRDQGKFRFLGITESTSRDPEHRMLQCALQDDLYETVMVGYHPANTAADQVVFPQASLRDVGVICMAAARTFIPRNASERMGVLGRTLAGLVISPPTDIPRLKARVKSAFADLVHSVPMQPGCQDRGGNAQALLLPEAIFTFALMPQPVASVLTGTTNRSHIERNVIAALAPALSGEDLARLRACSD